MESAVHHLSLPPPVNIARKDRTSVGIETEGVFSQCNRRINLQRTRGERVNKSEVTFRREICDLDVLVAERDRQM